MDGDLRWFAALREILSAAHLVRPDRLAATVSAAMAPLGLRTRIWLVDYEQVTLRALPEPDTSPPPPLPVDSTLAGRAFSRVTSLPGADPSGNVQRWWVPMVDGTDRLGVVEFTPTRPEVAAPEPACAPDSVAAGESGLVERCELVAGLAGHLIASTTPRSDHLDLARRSRPMTPAAELLWRVVPPLTASADRVVISAVLQPCYEVGGDGFDYVLDGEMAYLVVLDAVGRGLEAGLVCATTLAAIRAARRSGGDLAAQAYAADVAVAAQFADLKFATAVLAELYLGTGRLRYVNAGHPRPLVLRAGRTVIELTGGARLPLGLVDSGFAVAQAQLEPGDRLLLHTDGVTETRTAGGDHFGLERLIDLAERHADAGLPVPETLRRLSHAVLKHQDGNLADDATLLMAQWSARAAAATAPGPAAATAPAVAATAPGVAAPRRVWRPLCRALRRPLCRAGLCLRRGPQEGNSDGDSRGVHHGQKRARRRDRCER